MFPIRKKGAPPHRALTIYASFNHAACAKESRTSLSFARELKEPFGLFSHHSREFHSEKGAHRTRTFAVSKPERDGMLRVVSDRP